MPPSIPHDIILDIIDSLQHDPKSLVQSSLVSRCFRVPCHKHLFYSISIPFLHPRKGMERLKHFLRLLTYNPEIATYVRELHIVDNDEDTGWATKTNILPRLLQKLRNLHTFSLVFRHMNHVAWTSLNPTLRSALVHLLQSNVLKALNLGNLCFDDPSIIALGLSNRLKKLGIVSCGHAVHADYPLLMPQTTHPNKTHLESLEIGGSISTRVLESLTHPQSNLTISQLRQLSIQGGSAQTMEAACSIIKTAFNTIESLRWIFPNVATEQLISPHKPTIVNPFGPIDVKVLKNLRHLLLGITSEKGESPCSGQFAWLARALLDTSLPHSLEEVTIVTVSTLFGVVSRANGARIRQIYRSLRNVGLDAIFGDNRRFPKLRKVTITVDPYDRIEDPNGFEDFLTTLFPLLSSKEILHTEFRDVHGIFMGA
ncbi:hypothetical protein BDZ94DRAFT_1299066 [Collybia nuda]|uniref:F-box domain-containing protein n=1 Tax=Collybia nuda TaxID=64659 RepID=A0A9P5Y1I8_9AGAR|nr:hypothetical protein BDZ94DRAFT_1299066 [Collybia nuda]